MKNITIIGAGTMGNGIAHAFAQKEYKVTIVDISNESLDKAIVTITKNLDRMFSKEKTILHKELVAVSGLSFWKNNSLRAFSAKGSCVAIT